MASKKCPKCGEDNPAEAVMCWACYTPLSGSAPLGAGLAGAATAALPKTTGAPIGVPTTDESAKKNVDPKIIGVGAFLLVGAIAAVLMSGMLGGSSSDIAISTGIDPAPADPSVPGIPGPSNGGGVAAPPLSGGGGGGAPPAPAPLPFKTIATPGGSFKTGTLGILISGNAASPAGTAKFAKDSFARTGRWTNMQVVVFTSAASGDAFANYQRQHNNAPLTSGDFQVLAGMGVWSGAPAYLDSRGSRDRIYYPSQKPNSWWPMN